VIAVNAYDEEKDVVQGFVEKQKLKQVVLLKGSDVALDIYGIEEYPGAFWIDREGKVVQREMGFEVERVPRMERKIEKLLGGQ
jgi:hypothetical protein